MRAVEILNIGNEILSGRVVNTNATWIGKEITKLGGRIKRITCTEDSVDAISAAFTEILERKPSLLIVSGGLGPTFDDLTLQGLAQALNVSLTLHPQALKEVQNAYEKLGYPMSKEREKMALFPAHESVKVLHNPEGTAPGLRLDYKEQTHVFCLPGVPNEMKAIFLESIIPILITNWESTYFEQSFTFYGLPESGVAPITTELHVKYPAVYIKSQPKQSEGNPLIEFHLSSYDEKAKELVQKVKSILKKELEQRVTTFE